MNHTPTDPGLTFPLDSVVTGPWTPCCFSRFFWYFLFTVDERNCL